MKTKYILITLILVTVLYSCNEEKTQEGVIETSEQIDQIEIIDSNDLINTFDTISINENETILEQTVLNFDCSYSDNQIGENNDNTSPIELIGLFENLRNNGESTYGYTLMMWKLDNEIIGFLNVYEGWVEPDRSGPITIGKLVNDSLSLNIWTKKSKSFKNWQDSDAYIYSFNGLMSDDKIRGNFSVYNCTTQEIIQNDDNEQVELKPSDMWELKSFNNIEEWREAYSYQLNYEE